MRRSSFGALVALATLVAGCSGTVSHDQLKSAEGTITGLTVAGVPGTAPAVRIAAPLAVEATRAETLVTGTGPPVVVDQLFVLQLTMYDARTGRKALSTYDPGQRAMAVKDTDGTLFPVLAGALDGVRQGGRIVLTVTAADGYGSAGAPQLGIAPGDPLVLVADVVAVPPADVVPAPRGAGRTPRPGLPRVVVSDGVPSGFDFAGVSRPDRLVVVPLIAGDGPPVRPDSLVVLKSLAQVWGRSVPFDDTYGKEPVLFPIGIGKVVGAWDRALVGVRRGSRLLVIAPPADAFGSAGVPPAVPGGATVAYVIDVLGVS